MFIYFFLQWTYVMDVDTDNKKTRAKLVQVVSLRGLRFLGVDTIMMQRVWTWRNLPQLPTQWLFTILDAWWSLQTSLQSSFLILQNRQRLHKQIKLQKWRTTYTCSKNIILVCYGRIKLTAKKRKTLWNM